jgi:hypothetical protein
MIKHVFYISMDGRTPILFLLQATPTGLNASFDAYRITELEIFLLTPINLNS